MEQGSHLGHPSGAGRSRLLGTDDPSPVIALNAQGASPFLLTGDHAGNRIPAALGCLGLSEEERNRHIGWDIGIMALGSLLSARLDAPFLAQRYSRLVVDCNRDPASAEAIPLRSDGTLIPGNQEMSVEEKQERIAALHAPYQRAIAEHIADREVSGRATVMIALHSFTPSMAGIDRPWHVGVLHAGGNDTFARRVLAHLAALPNLIAGDNEPYRMDSTDYSIPHHAIAAGLPYAEIEVRQDLIAGAAGQEKWCDILAHCLERALPEEP